MIIICSKTLNMFSKEQHVADGYDLNLRCWHARTMRVASRVLQKDVGFGKGQKRQNARTKSLKNSFLRLSEVHDNFPCHIVQDDFRSNLYQMIPLYRKRPGDNKINVQAGECRGGSSERFVFEIGV
mmetsp:Transcript_39877/g.70139  ORF Transcript_39877/g.70139 Transcript_39877/m.70139 type:complete len:126 (+) Transcript_39877:1253-1630(+)